MPKEYQSEKSPIFDSHKSPKTLRKLHIMSQLYAYNRCFATPGSRVDTMETIKSHIHTVCLTLFRSYTLPILHSSHLPLFQSYTLFLVIFSYSSFQPFSHHLLIFGPRIGGFLLCSFIDSSCLDVFDDWDGFSSSCFWNIFIQNPGLGKGSKKVWKFS